MNNLIDDWNRLTLLHSLARHIDHQITCILAIPNSQPNYEVIDGYKTRLAKTLEETRELLNKDRNNQVVEALRRALAGNETIESPEDHVEYLIGCVQAALDASGEK